MRIFNLFFIAGMILMSVSCFGQNKGKADSVAELLKTYINIQNTQALYALTSKKYQAEINQDKLSAFYTSKLFPLGQVTEMTFLELRDAAFIYKLGFDKVTLELTMILDSGSKLDLLQFKPFVANKPVRVATSNPNKTALERQIDSLVRTYIQKPNTVGLSVGIINKGAVTTYGYGETAIGNVRLPDAGTIFEIGSITKTFTATLLAHYVLAGKVQLSDPITKYLPDSVAANKNLQNITLAELSNHTSGLPSLPLNFFLRKDVDRLNPYKNYTKQLLYTYLKNCSPLSAPGQVFAYSNMGVGLLGLILEKVSGKTFEQMVNEFICKPLGMTGTAQHLSPELLQKFVSVYNAEGAPTPAWDFDALKACGTLHSCISDLLLYIQANMQSSGRLAKEFALTRRVTFNKKEQIGLGWFIIKVGDDVHYFHNGGTYGSSSFLAFNTEKNVAVVLLSNSALSADALGFSLLKLIE